jgi:hypothetical protein
VRLWEGVRTKGLTVTQHTFRIGGEDEMINTVILKRIIVVVLGAVMFTDIGTAYAFDICKNMFERMNQLERRGDYGDREGYYGDPWGGPSYGYRRGRGYGYGSPGYGYSGPPAYGYMGPAYSGPQPETDALQAQIYQLELRLEKLEKALIHQSSQQQTGPTDPGTQ